VAETNSLLSGVESTAPELDTETIREWQTTRRNLAFANAALSIANAQEFVGGESDNVDTTAPAN
jgi:hypothetical protein